MKPPKPQPQSEPHPQPERSIHAWEQVNLAASIADLKDQHYRTLLALGSLLDLLIDKGLISREDLERKAAQLDAESEREMLTRLLSASLHPRE